MSWALGAAIPIFAPAQAAHGTEILPPSREAAAQYNKALRTAVVGARFRQPWLNTALLYTLVVPGHRLLGCVVQLRTVAVWLRQRAHHPGVWVVVGAPGPPHHGMRLGN